jgi:hypothetical protein
MRIGLLGAFVVALTAAACAGTDSHPLAVVQPQDSTVESAAKNNAVATTRQAADAQPQQPTAVQIGGVCASNQNMSPPCMSTWPQGSPNYHGPIPGNY